MWGALFTGARNLLGGAIMRWGGKSVIADKVLGAAASTVGTTGKVAEATGGFLSKIKGLWSKTPRIAKIGAGGYAGVEGVQYAGDKLAESIPGVDVMKNAGKYLPWALGAAAIGGLFLAFKDRIFGASDEPAEVRQPAPTMQPAQAVALTPEEQLLAPQMSAPMVLGSTVTASYPAAVATPTGAVVRSAERPETTYASGRPRPERAENNWQARVGGQKAPVESYAARETVADTHLAEQQSRADAVASQQKVL